MGLDAAREWGWVIRRARKGALVKGRGWKKARKTCLHNFKDRLSRHPKDLKAEKVRESIQVKAKKACLQDFAGPRYCRRKDFRMKRGQGNKDSGRIFPCQSVVRVPGRRSEEAGHWIGLKIKWTGWKTAWMSGKIERICVKTSGTRGMTAA